MPDTNQARPFERPDGTWVMAVAHGRTVYPVGSDGEHFEGWATAEEAQAAFFDDLLSTAQFSDNDMPKCAVTGKPATHTVRCELNGFAFTAIVSQEVVDDPALLASVMDTTNVVRPT